jgi:site-specific DNA-cytosine methylase
MTNYASIVPLIGGETLAMEAAFGKRPEYILSYEPFANNDQHIVAHYNNEVPYHILTENNNTKFKNVDVVNTVCPCAGLSSLSLSASAENNANDWMYKTANYVLEEMQPRVFWGENSPQLAGKVGEPVVQKLRQIGEANGYIFSIFKTRSLLHGLPQVRNRAFYFFWKDDAIPVFDWFTRELEPIADLISAINANENDSMDVLTNTKTPSDDPWYRYILEELEGGLTHQQFVEKIDKSYDTFHYIETHGPNYMVVKRWMEENNFPKQAKRCVTMYKKLKAGGSIMRRGVCIPKGNLGAFVGHLPTMTAHPVEDRFLTIRECLAIMKMPDDFILQGGKKNLNHICQNVPVSTATDMANQIKKYLNGELDSINASYMIQNNLNCTLDIKREINNLEAFL